MKVEVLLLVLPEALVEVSVEVPVQLRLNVNDNFFKMRIEDKNYWFLNRTTNFDLFSD